VHEGLKMSFAPFIFKAVSEAGLGAAPTIARVRLFYVLPLLAVGLVIAFYLRDLVRLINQPAYLPVAHYGPLLIGPPVIISMFAYFASGLLLSKRSDLLWIPTLAHLLVLLVGGLWLIPRWQMDGIIVNRYLSSVIYVGVAAHLSQKYFPIPVNARTLTLLFASFALGIAAAMWNTTESLPGSIVVSTLGVLTFVAVHALIIGGPGRVMRGIRERFSPGVPS
jgi:O-antigen/teichoic acid export membrane protein